MKKIKFLLAIGILTSLISCKTESVDFNTNSIVTDDGQISKELVKDSLFDKFDKADYEMRRNYLNSAGGSIDWEKDRKINQDFKDRKFKSLQEFAVEKEKVGNKDYLKRLEININAFKAKDELFNKYPELKTIPLTTFFKFFRENSKYNLTEEDLNSYTEKLIENRKKQ